MKTRRFFALFLTLALLAAALPASAATNNFYIIPDSDSRYFTKDELWDWQYEALGYIYNEIFARHGRAFKTGQKYDVFFRSQAWYEVNPSYRYGLLNKIEQANERLAHDVLIEMRAQKTTNKGGKALPRNDAEASASGALSFRSYELRAGQKLSVYTGPGTNYVRAANGKAAVSTNATLKIAGTENGWALVEYEVQSGVHRVGYVQVSQIKDKLDLPRLALYNELANTSRSCGLTDDPDGQARAIATLEANAEIYLLSPYATKSRDWVYVEAYSDAGLVRGFIPQEYVASNPDEFMTDEELGVG